MANMGSQGILKHIDDPSVTVISATEATSGIGGAGITWLSEGDDNSNDADFIKAVAAGKGLHYKGVLGNTSGSKIEFAGNALQFYAQEGHAAAEMIVQFSVMTSLAFTFGFNDDILDTSADLPMTNTATTIAANSGAFVGLIYDSGSTDLDNMYCAWVNGGTVGQTDSTGKVDGKYIKMAGMAPTAAKWFYLKVDIDDRGSGLGARATFLAIDHLGRSVEKVFNTTITRSTPLCFHFAAQNRAAVEHTIYIKCPNWEQSIPNM